MTTLEPAAFEACGWSGQLLVRFVIRAGRLSEWSQERCGRAAATAALAATPAGWAGFAQRSAAPSWPPRSVRSRAAEALTSR